LDIAIIGCGVSGSYAAWKLKDENLTISIFENHNRIGGRLYTRQFEGLPGTNLEFGAMRFTEASKFILRYTFIICYSVVHNL